MKGECTNHVIGQNTTPLVLEEAPQPLDALLLVLVQFVISVFGQEVLLIQHTAVCVWIKHKPVSQRLKAVDDVSQLLDTALDLQMPNISSAMILGVCVCGGGRRKKNMENKGSHAKMDKEGTRCMCACVETRLGSSKVGCNVKAVLGSNWLGGAKCHMSPIVCDALLCLIPLGGR